MVRWRTERLADQVELVDVGEARPERLAGDQLGEHAADRPDVDRRPVQRVADQQLGRAVPARRHIVRVLVAGPRCAQRNAANSSIVNADGSILENDGRSRFTYSGDSSRSRDKDNI